MLMRTLSLASLALLAPAFAPAATYVVTRFDDPSPKACAITSCSLREAVIAANNNAGADRIDLAAGTYTLTRGDATPYTLEAGSGALWVSDSVEIVGAGAGSTRIQRTTPFGIPTRFFNEVFAIQNGGAVALDIQGATLSGGRGPSGGCLSVRDGSGATHELVLRDITIEDCKTTGFGGAIRMGKANLTMSSVRLRNNSADYDGGAIALLHTANVISSNVQISANSATRYGGAISVSGNPVPYIPDVIWFDDGSMVISGNTAERGGAIYSFLARFTLESADLSSAGNWITLSNNSATTGGAAYAGGAQPTTQFKGVRFLDNRAGTGGALWSNTGLVVERAEFVGNQATAGDGGAISLPTSWIASSIQVAQTSFRNNIATGGGGAIFSGCAGFEASNVSFGGNSAAVNRGQAIENTGPGLLRHATVHNNSGPHAGQSPGIQQIYDSSCGSGANEIMRFANSLVTDNCGLNISRLRSEGGNQYGPAADICRVTANDVRQSSTAPFRLSNGRFGGPADVWGWTNTSLVPVPQRDFGLAQFCTTTDIRGFARSTRRCDSGAFEQQ